MAAQWLGADAETVSLGKEKQGKKDTEILVNGVCVIWKQSQAKFSKYRVCMLIISLHADLGSLGAHRPAGGALQKWGWVGIGTSCPLSFPENYQLHIRKDLAVGSVLVTWGE